MPAWLTRQFAAMGCRMALWLEPCRDDAPPDLLDRVVAHFAAAEARLSRFLADSELTRLNSRPDEWVVVSAEFWPLLTRALELAAATDGRFDPTILPALEHAGYTRSFDALGATAPAPAAPPRPVDYRAVALDPARRAVRLPPGVRIDLGGIAKGHTAQQALRHLRRWGACLLDAGGDLVAGAAPVGQPGWPVAVAAPWADGERVARLWLADGCLATSGVDYRRWQQAGRSRHHIIDPRTGDSAETDLLTVTVLAADACTAEAWATAALVAGRERGRALLTRHRLPAVLIDAAGRVTLTPAMRPLAQPEPC